MSLEGQVALITGAASGIGYAYAKNLLENGVKVVLCDVDFENCQLTADGFDNEFGVGRVLPLQCDVTDQESFENAFKSCISHFKQLDIVVNNAGVFNESMENWEATMNTNYGGVVRGTLLAIKYMGAPYGGKGGTVVQTASITALFVSFHVAPIYKSTGRAIIEYTREIGSIQSFKHLNVRVMALCPGYVDTKFFKWDRPSDYLIDNFIEPAKEIMASHKIQTADNVGKALIEILRLGRTAACWIVENGEPPRPANIPDTVPY